MIFARSNFALNLLLAFALSSIGQVAAAQHVDECTPQSQPRTQSCGVKKTICTNTKSQTITVYLKLKDKCREPEDQGELSIVDKSGNQIGPTFKFSQPYEIPVNPDVPPGGHIEYICGTHELGECTSQIVEPPTKSKPVRTMVKDPCSKVYPIPDGADKWTNCVKSGASACGGPDQCACDSTERLVEYTCTEGKYNKCTAESACNDARHRKQH